LASPYRPGSRTGDWLKVKAPRRELVVIAGWMPSDVQASNPLPGLESARPVRLLKGFAK
jgi:ATP-dependent DNA ligase